MGTFFSFLTPFRPFVGFVTGCVLGIGGVVTVWGRARVKGERFRIDEESVAAEG